MGNFCLILFISFAAPLLMTMLVCRGKARTLLMFLLFGMVVCLFCGELNAIVLKLLPFDMVYFSSNVSPFFEEVFKAVPILLYAFLFKPSKRMLLECSVLVGVGFAVLENAFVLGGAAGHVSVINALIRGFGAGMMHGICTLAVGCGMTLVHIRRKLFVTGTLALLSAASIYHSLFNTLVQSEHRLVGLLLPAVTLIPVLFLLKRMTPSEKAADACPRKG